MHGMTTEDSGDINRLAGEYVLGTLSAGQRQDVERRLAHEPALRDAVQFWEEKLLPLTELVEPVAPSPQLWKRISASLDRSRVPWWRLSLGKAWNSLPAWRTAAVTAAVAALAMAIAWPRPTAEHFMVVLGAPQDKAPGWVVQAGANRQLRLIPLAPEQVPEEKSLQFWTKGEGWNAPMSLGLVKPGEPLVLRMDQLPPLQPNQLFEITLEPPAGSPIGRPTGPILYLGRAVKVV